MEKPAQLTDEIFAIIGTASGKVSDSIRVFQEVESLLKKELSREYIRGYHAASQELEEKNKLKQQREN
ncbi:hypothetical protein ASG31_08280 [Chryseobacterium sp. Leaf404]|uniref:hypothetical protein n=1 Tax=unclassified Chryseobacterium TaxID=2593645 RepID=UPI0006F30BF0|nr:MULTISPECIES: hypothetical protein [unclassified Chryseobacterium]KQT17398.1 hypothetical protein ASG31_08280 [Chryseobacterium sp. Leaf404]